MTGLHELLTELHSQLAAAQAVKPEDRDLLERLAKDIRETLDGGGAVKAAAPLRAKMQRAVTVFEASHPALSRALANAIDALALYNL